MKVYSIDEFTCISEGQVTYTVGSKVLDPIPIMSIFKFVHNPDIPLVIESYRAYINNTPLFIAAGYDFTADPSNNTIMIRRVTEDSQSCKP